LLLLVSVHLGLEGLEELDLLLLILHGGLGQLGVLLGLGFESELGKVGGEDRDGLGGLFGETPCLGGQGGGAIGSGDGGLGRRGGVLGGVHLSLLLMQEC
jgi:hypothetical protein